MYNNIREVFNKEKMSVMIDDENKDKIYFPNKVNPNLECDINSNIALACATVLKSGFNVHGIELKKINDNEISVIFEDNEIQKLYFYDSNEVDKNIKNTSLKADKTTIVIFNKEKFLNNDEPFEAYINFLKQFSINSNKTISVDDLRYNSLKNTGIYIEEYEGKTKHLDGNDILNPIKISHHNTLTSPIVLDILNLEDNKREFENIKRVGNSFKNIEIQTTIESVRNIPLESNNPILNVSNYRDLDTKHIADTQINDFLNTIIEQTKTHLKLKEKLRDAKENSKIKENIIYSIEKNREIQGSSKKLFSLAPHELILEENNTENKLYISNNKVCINSKGTCLGNGQHSSTTFNMLNLILNYGADSKFELFENLDLSSSKLSKLFNVSDKNPIFKIQSKLFTIIKENEIDIIDFLDFFNSMKFNISWDIVSDLNIMESKIKADNNNREQDKSDFWINENKEYLSIWISKYREINSEIISKYKNNGISLDITAIKTPGSSPRTSLGIIDTIKINDIYPYLLFLLPKTKNLTPIDSNFTINHSDKSKESSNNVRNVYQPEIFIDKFSIFWSDILHKKFKKAGNLDTFTDFVSVNTNESKTVIKNKLKKNIKFHNIYESLSLKKQDEELFNKVAACAILKNKAETFFAETHDKLNQVFKNAISADNFTNLVFFSFVSKLGKNNFNVENIEIYSDIVLKDIMNSFIEYYSNSSDITKSTDRLKRISIKDYNDLSLETRELAKKFTINLFEPYQNKNTYNNNEHYNYIDEESWKNTIVKNKIIIENKFDNFFNSKNKNLFKI